MGRIIWNFMLIVVIFSYGCVNTPRGQAADTAVDVEVVHGGTVCSGASTSPIAVWIDTPQMLKNHWQRMHRHRIGKGKPTIPQIEWDTHGLVLIRMGQKPSGGYRLELIRNRAPLKDGTAHVGVKWKAPPANAITTMMITNPCLLVKIKRGDYNSVAIVDQSGHQRTRVDL